MRGAIGKIVADIARGARAPVYLLVGDELLAREGAKAIVDALVPAGHQPLNVETVGDEDAASVRGRLCTVPLFGGVKVVVVHDTKAFASKQSRGELFKRSRDAWADGDERRADRILLQALAAAGLDRHFLERAALGVLPESVWEDVVGLRREEETERWLQETSERLVRESATVEEASGTGPGRVYDDVIRDGIPPRAVLILTAEVADQRRALFKRIAAAGVVVDCGVRVGKLGETQMKPEAARARIKDAVGRFGKRIEEGGVAAIVERTGFSVRALDSELEKILLYVGKRPEVRKEDVLEVLSNSREASIFDMTNALEERDPAAAIRALRALAAQREAAQAVLGMMASTVRGLIVARSALDCRLDGRFDDRMPYAAFQARILPKLAAPQADDDGAAAKLQAMHPFRVFNLLKASGRFTQAELVRGLTAIHDADLALKSGGQADSVILETLALRLCGGERHTP